MAPTAFAIGLRVQAVCKGKDGKAIAISMGDETCVVSAAEGGRLIIVSTTWTREYESTFVADIDGVRFFPGIRYTVDEQTGEWSAVGEDDPFADVEELPESQIEEAMARALAL